MSFYKNKNLNNAQAEQARWIMNGAGYVMLDEYMCETLNEDKAVYIQHEETGEYAEIANFAGLDASFDSFVCCQDYFNDFKRNMADRNLRMGEDIVVVADEIYFKDHRSTVGKYEHAGSLDSLDEAAELPILNNYLPDIYYSDKFIIVSRWLGW